MEKDVHDAIRDLEADIEAVLRKVDNATSRDLLENRLYGISNLIYDFTLLLELLFSATMFAQPRRTYGKRCTRRD